MEKEFAQLKLRLEELEEKIRAVEKQLPAHSVKTPIMIQLLELEDERDALLSEIERFRSQALDVGEDP